MQEVLNKELLEWNGINILDFTFLMSYFPLIFETVFLNVEYKVGNIFSQIIIDLILFSKLLDISWDLPCNSFSFFFF